MTWKSGVFAQVQIVWMGIPLVAMLDILVMERHRKLFKSPDRDRCDEKYQVEILLINQYWKIGQLLQHQEGNVQHRYPGSDQ